MAIDFSSLGDSDSFDTELNPRVLFDLLPEKEESKFGYPRDVQSEVMEQWFARRAEQNLTIKMNTGGGKTIVGLLLLKSCINEGVSPAVYIAPTPYLAEQVIAEAKSVGIPVVEDPKSPKYQNGSAILVTYIHRLINGRSVFGVGSEGVKIPIGSIVIDDAHACLETAEEKYALTAPSGHPVYDGLFELFNGDLAQQSLTRLLDIKEQMPGKILPVPYWAWLDKQKEVVAILSKHSQDKLLEWCWPLLQEHLSLCHCIFGEGIVEITPRCLPITTIPAFCAAARRIFMSATFSDNSVLISDFDVPEAAVTSPITPSRANDLGDRMILVPQEFSPNLEEEDLRSLAAKLAIKHNVLVLVPSGKRAKFWESTAALTLNADNLAEGVTRLKAGHVGLVVVINKYDGIDLPDDACRVLIVDGVPKFRSKIDRVEEDILWSSEWIHSRHIQRIEQGMGRGIRSQEDYCAVILMGSVLTSALYIGNAATKFTPATKVQLGLARKLAGQLEDASIEDIEGVIGTFLARDKKWVAVSRAAIAAVKHGKSDKVDPIALAQRKAFNASVINQYKESVALVDAVAQAEPNARVKGWLKQEAAFYEHFRSPASAQAIQSAAIKLNSHVLRPIAGFEYSRLSPAGDQASACSQYLRSKFKAPHELVLAVNAMIDDLQFAEDTSERFENALAEIGRMLGFGSTRPDNEIGKGPDNLWCVATQKYFVIEAKNGATTDAICKHDCDQLGGSVRWFFEVYDIRCIAIPIIIHPSDVFSYYGTPPIDTRVMTKEQLEKLRAALMQFASSMAKLDNFGSRDDTLPILTLHKLLPDTFVSTYTIKHKREAR